VLAGEHDGAPIGTAGKVLKPNKAGGYAATAACRHYQGLNRGQGTWAVYRTLWGEATGDPIEAAKGALALSGEVTYGGGDYGSRVVEAIEAAAASGDKVAKAAAAAIEAKAKAKAAAEAAAAKAKADRAAKAKAAKAAAAKAAKAKGAAPAAKAASTAKAGTAKAKAGTAAKGRRTAAAKATA
jgi:hypothetical protein